MEFHNPICGDICKIRKNKNANSYNFDALFVLISTAKLSFTTFVELITQNTSHDY